MYSAYEYLQTEALILFFALAAKCNASETPNDDAMIPTPSSFTLGCVINHSIASSKYSISRLFASLGRSS